MPAIKDDYRKNITAIMLENQEKALREAEIANHSGVDSVFGDTSGAFNAVGGFNPVLISLVRRAMPNLIAYDVCGVQPMSGPTGLIFAMKAKFGNHGSAEALFDEAPTGFGATVGFAGTADGVGFPISGGTGDPIWVPWMATGDELTRGSDGPKTSLVVLLVLCSRWTLPRLKITLITFNDMSFVIDRQSVVAKTRALKAEYTSELAQDLKAVHGLDAETELANILSAEILAEINREVIRSIYVNAKLGCQQE